MKVKEILMTKPRKVFLIHPDSTIREAAHILAENNIGVVLVVDEEERLVGILSERDIVREAVYSEGLLFDQQVKRIMTTHLTVAEPDDELDHLVQAMMEKNIRHLPVLEGDEVIGLLSIKDLVKAMQVKYEGEIHHLRQYGVWSGHVAKAALPSEEGELLD
jgi:CBS domain-containing protein